MSEYDAHIQALASESLGRRVRRRRKELGMSQVQLAAAARMNQGYLSEIERDRRRPSANTRKALAIALDLPEAVLIGAGSDHDNPQPVEIRSLPIFGRIPAGPPASTQEQYELFPVLRHLWSPDHYCLRLTFDSMEPTLKPGDIVLVHYRPDVDPVLVQGRICACLVDGDPTLKRVSVAREQHGQVIILRGDNPTVAPMIIDATHDFSIQGVVTRLVSREL